MAKFAICISALIVVLLLQYAIGTNADFVPNNGTRNGTRIIARSANGTHFVQTNGAHFILNGHPFYSNGFNAYWLMYIAKDLSKRNLVSTAFQQASSRGLNLVRAWAFSDAGDIPLQISPGSYNEDTFKGLDFVISEAGKHGIYLVLSLANDNDDFGGKKQYVKWATDRGQKLNNVDDFYRNDLVKGWYKNHTKAVLKRVNTITGIAYKDDPTIFAWELMNEPRCHSDLSGATLQNWISEMAPYVKSIDSNHMLEVGLEGYYGESMPDRKQFNPGYQIGTDFISNNKIPQIDFVTIHMYADQWIQGADDQAQLSFTQSWITSHVNDAGSVIEKPLMITEFGKNTKTSTAGQRDALYSTVYNRIYNSANSGGAGTGALFWQLMVEGMDNWRDGYEIIFSENPSTAELIVQQSTRIFSLNYPHSAKFSAGRKLGKPKN